jgi:hypothetical protein
VSETIDPVARMTVRPVRRGRGRPEAARCSGLRERAWWLMRTLPRFTLDDLLFTLADGGERDAAGNLRKYCRALERVGVLRRLDRRAPGRAPTSNGLVIWRLVRDLGRQAPVWRTGMQALWDPNCNAYLWPVQTALVADADASATAGTADAGNAAQEGQP